MPRGVPGRRSARPTDRQRRAAVLLEPLTTPTRWRSERRELTPFERLNHQSTSSLLSARGDAIARRSPLQRPGEKRCDRAAEVDRGPSGNGSSDGDRGLVCSERRGGRGSAATSSPGTGSARAIVATPCTTRSRRTACWVVTRTITGGITGMKPGCPIPPLRTRCRTEHAGDPLTAPWRSAGVPRRAVRWTRCCFTGAAGARTSGRPNANHHDGRRAVTSPDGAALSMGWFRSVGKHDATGEKMLICLRYRRARSRTTTQESGNASGSSRCG
jgi:hypothetical protein